MDNHYGFIGKFLAHPGKRDELLTILLQAAKALEGNPDCLLYLISTRDEEPDAIWSTEIWTTKTAHDAALKPEPVQAAIRQAMPLIQSVPKATELKVAGGKGLEALGSAEHSR